MATIYRCDRCNDETNNKSEIVTLEIPSLDYHQSRIVDGNETKHDLCVQCIKQLREFLKKLPKEAAK